jgi:hypothetical protein
VRIEETASKNPAMALKLARAAPEYASRVGGVDFEARAWALKGSIERILGDLPAARDSFGHAFAVLGDRDTAEAAGVKWQVACLRGEEGSVSDGLLAVRQAIDYFRKHRSDPEVDSCDRLSLAAALNREAILLWKSGQKCSEVAQLFLRALRETNEHTKRTAAVASKNFAAASAMAWMSGEPGYRADRALAQIKRARRDLSHFGYDRHTLWGARLQWVEGNGLSFLFGGFSDAAEYHFVAAKSTLLDLGAKQDVVLLNLDIGYWLILDGNWARLEILARETLDLAISAGFGAEKTTALKQWIAAIERRTLEEQVFRAVYREIRGLDSVQLPLERKAEDDDPIGW